MREGGRRIVGYLRKASTSHRTPSALKGEAQLLSRVMTSPKQIANIVSACFDDGRAWVERGRVKSATYFL